MAAETMCFAVAVRLGVVHDVEGIVEGHAVEPDRVGFDPVFADVGVVFAPVPSAKDDDVGMGGDGERRARIVARFLAPDPVGRGLIEVERAVEPCGHTHRVVAESRDALAGLIGPEPARHGFIAGVRFVDVVPQRVRRPLHLIEADQHQRRDGDALHPDFVPACAGFLGPGEPERGDQTFPDHARMARRQIHPGEDPDHQRPGHETDPADLSARGPEDESLDDDQSAGSEREGAEIRDGESQEPQRAGDLVPERFAPCFLKRALAPHGQFTGQGPGALQFFLPHLCLRGLTAQVGPEPLRGHLQVFAGGEVDIAGRKDRDHDEDPGAAQDGNGNPAAHHDARACFAVQQSQRHHGEADGGHKSVNGEIGQQRKKNGEPHKLTAAGRCIGRAHAAQNRGCGEGEDREEDVAARDHRILIGEPESEREKDFEDERKRRPAQENIDARQGDEPGGPAHAGVAEVKARQDPEKGVPQARGAFIADSVQHEVPETRIARQQPGLGLIGPGLVVCDADGDERCVSGEDGQLNPLPELRGARLALFLPALLFLDKKRPRAFLVENRSLRPRHTTGAQGRIATARRHYDTHFSRRMTPMGVALECAETSVRRWISSRRVS
ncbi:MAG TPA: hypothetical protein VL990_08785 [Acidobacteriaceae bacterium]|nr:hypothetical protein [Acidobacteriaceae bacterium]